MSNKAMVAVCDILGFSNLVKHTPLQEMVNYHSEKNIINILKSSIPQFDNPSVSPSKEEIFHKDLVGFQWFSDTVLVYSLRDDKSGYLNVIDTVTRLISYCKWPDYRFRAGIAYGEFYANPQNRIYVGKALVEAHELEQKQEWCGAALTQSAAEKINNNYKYLIKYPVPCKKGTEDLLAIDWTQGYHDLIDQEYGWLVKNDELYNSLSDEQKKRIDKKLENTEKFHTDRCVQCEMNRKHKK